MHRAISWGEVLACNEILVALILILPLRTTEVILRSLSGGKSCYGQDPTSRGELSLNRARALRCYVQSTHEILQTLLGMHIPVHHPMSVLFPVSSCDCLPVCSLQRTVSNRPLTHISTSSITEVRISNAYLESIYAENSPLTLSSGRRVSG